MSRSPSPSSWITPSAMTAPSRICTARAVWHAGPRTDEYRRLLLARTVVRWRDCVRSIEDGADAVGPNWRPDFRSVDSATPCPHFSGNYWIASCEYVRRLAPCSTEDRHRAEFWIGLGSPSARDAPLARPQDLAALAAAYEETHDGPVCVLPARAGLQPARNGLSPDWVYLRPLEGWKLPPGEPRCFCLEGMECAACGAGGSPYASPGAPPGAPLGERPAAPPLIFDEYGRVDCARDRCPAEQMCPIVRSILAAGKKT
jgi:hypothetical protein